MSQIKHTPGVKNLRYLDQSKNAQICSDSYCREQLSYIREQVIEEKIII